MLLVALLSLPFLFVLVRKPLLRRLAVRYARRRPREAMLVLLGSLLGTAIITGSFIVGDTLDASIRRSAFTQLGPVDEVVRAPTTEAAASVEEAARSMGGDVDGVLRTGTVDAAVSTPGPSPKAEPNAHVYEVDFDLARRFGGDPEATGVSGPTPREGEAAIGADLAETLQAQVGDRVVLNAYGTRTELTVARQLPRLGVAGLNFEQTSESPSLFVAPGTLSRLHARAPHGASPPSVLVLVSNSGGVLDGALGSDRVKAGMERALAGVPVTVEAVKQDRLKAADAAGKEFAELFGGIGFFSVLAGILLLVNIFVMLAQERKTELGMLRAMGLRRVGLVGSFSLEGWLYALVASALGTVAGLAVGRVIVVVAAGIFAAGDFAMELRYKADLASVQQGFATGFVISLATVVVTSVWVSRLNVIRAIRDLPDPEGEGRRFLSLVVGGVAAPVGGVLTASAVGADDPYLILGGPAIAGFGAVLLLRRLLPRRAVVSVISLGILVWGIVAFDLFPDAFENADIPVFVEQGVILTAAAVALVSQNQATIGALLRRVGGSSSLSLRLGLAYPLARRFRTGMILTMYALVVFTLTFITVFSHLFQGQIDDFTREASGGFDLRVSSNAANPIPAGEMAAMDGVEGAADMAVVTAQWEAPGSDGFDPWPVAGIDQGLVARGGPALSERDARYPDDQSAYRAVVADPSLVVVPEFFLEEGGGGPPEEAVKPGDTVRLRDPVSGRARQLAVVGIAEGGFANAFAFTSRSTVDEVFGPSATTNTWYVSTGPGTDVEALADRINGRFLANGADAESFRKTVSDNMAQQQQFFRLMQGYLALGLVIGIAGLGVVMVRAVRERRRQVGILRSLGFEAGAVRKAFVAESAFVALEGISIGCVLAIVTSWRLISNETFGELDFSVPWGQLGLLVAGTFLASMLATATPAQQASRIRPAVALRLAD
ncbi:MAG: ABC transporter permease [Actinomycetota bacterium]|nr:ABC transporter permease [Actinomycetota bacterium]